MVAKIALVIAIIALSAGVGLMLGAAVANLTT